MNLSRLYLRILAAVGYVAMASLAVNAATLTGIITGQDNAPLKNAQILVPALQKATTSDSSGQFKLDNLPTGVYTVQVRLLGYTDETRQADLSKGNAELQVTLLSGNLTLAPITITAAPEAASTLNTPASVTVVEGRQLDRQKGQSVMSAIQDQPGIDVHAEGPTVVKPIIRGLSSQDIVVVEDGIRSEAVQWGNEHAPEIDPLGTDRIEVMRGPNSLMYGSDALGGVISITHPELPDTHLGAGPLSGRFTSAFNSVNRSVGENFEASGAEGDWGYRGNISQQQAGNFRNPEIGYVTNTGLQEISGDGEIGVRKDWGSLSADYGHFYKRVELQNPSAPFPGPLSDTEFQALSHDHAAVDANIITAPARFDIIAGYNRANRQEFDAPNTDPHLNWIETNYTLDMKAHIIPIGPFQTTMGLSGLDKVGEVLGNVHLTPPYSETGVGEYAMVDLPLGPFDFTAGLRGDQDHYAIGSDNQIGIDPDNNLNNPHPVNAQTLNYSAWSGAIGGVYHITEPLAFAVNVGRGYRNPIPFELFGFGVHEGGGEFLIGDPGLTPETSFNTDASLRWASPRFKAEVGAFQNKIHNFIFGSFTGATDPGTGLPVVQETQGDAKIEGVDGAATFAATHWLTLKSVYSMVRGYNTSGDPSLPTDALPHVPADKLVLGSDIHDKSLGFLSNPYFGFDTKLVQAQHYTGPNEIPTAGYVLWNLHTGCEVVVMNNRVTLDAGVDNLFNKGYIDYNSILKEFNIEDPGRNVWVRASIPFGS